MSPTRRGPAAILATIFFFGWLSYPGWNWWGEYYFAYPEKYAHPASLSNSCDPPYGFWYW
jgi:hypothetical protein